MATIGWPPARYDTIADWYEAYIHGEAEPFTRRVRDALRLVLGRGAGPLVDLGCGTGAYAPLLRELGWSPAGVDVSAAQLRHARRHMPVALADAARPPLRPGSLAAVAAIMCHTDIDDYAEALAAVSTALRPGGVLAHVGVHPCFIGAFADRSAPDMVRIGGGYWERGRSWESWSPRGVRSRVGAVHVPLGELLTAFPRAGLDIEKVIEVGQPVPDVLAIRCVRRR